MNFILDENWFMKKIEIEKSINFLVSHSQFNLLALTKSRNHLQDTPLKNLHINGILLTISFSQYSV